MLFFAKFGNNQFDEASSYHTKQFKAHVAVKEMINLRDEMDTRGWSLCEIMEQAGAGFHKP